MLNVNEGDTVEVSMAGGGKRVGVVVEVSDNIKNGFPGIAFESQKDGLCWCYMDQITKVN